MSQSWVSLSLLLVVGALCCSSTRINTKLNIDLDTRIVNGKEAVRGQFPFYTLLFLDTPKGRGACGGVLIKPKIVLTAAHCLETTTSVEAHFGALQVNKPDEPGRVVVKSTTFFVHPQYVPQVVWNDIGFVAFAEPIALSETIQPIALPESVYLPTDSPLEALGFGLLNTTDTKLAPVLQHATLHTISHVDCARVFPFIFFRRSVICTKGHQLESTCNGDSGGPLVQIDPENPKTPTLIGLTSFGSAEGCHLGYPSAFTRVAAYADYIKSVIDTFE